VGNPAKYLRDLTEEEFDLLEKSSAHYTVRPSFIAQRACVRACVRVVVVVVFNNGLMAMVAIVQSAGSVKAARLRILPARPRLHRRREEGHSGRLPSRASLR